MGGTDEALQGWFAGRIPDGWFTGPPEVTSDREEILIVGTLPDVDAGEDATEATAAAAREGRIKQFREDTRDSRIRIAREAEHRFGRKVSWGVRIGDAASMFTTLSVPVMTRLRMRERDVLDTLVDSGVARSRSHALAWCVKLVAEKQGEWLKDLQDAMVQVQQVREAGPITQA
jgi:hypothetical protein